METKRVEVQYNQRGGAAEAEAGACEAAEAREHGWKATGSVRWLWAEPGDRTGRWVGIEVELVRA